MTNKSENFICKNVYLKPHTIDSPLTCNLEKDKTYKIPIAHADGRYFADETVLKSLVQNDQILFQYAHEDGRIDDLSNINGSCLNIAGICNLQKMSVVSCHTPSELQNLSLEIQMEGKFWNPFSFG